MSAITPPVAVAAYAASSIAEDNPLLIAVMAVKFALAAFIVPFVFVYGPELLMIGSWHVITVSLVTAIIGLILIAAALESYFQDHLALWERLLLGAVGFGLVVPSYYSAGVSVVIFMIYFVPRYVRQKLKV
jgi:TRAP-type uncharacterized transport system fused permease subunit